MTSSALKAGKKKMKVDKPKYVEKDWGSETWFANNLEHNYCGKILEGMSMEMPQGVPHSLIASEVDVKLIEASTFHRDEDSYRLWKTNKPIIKA